MKNKLFFPNPAILIFLWSIAAVCDCLWLILDNSVPGWDQSAHLTGALNNWLVLQHSQIFSGDWWHSLWQQSTSYRGPLIYIVTVPFFNLFGRGYHQAMLVNLLFTAIILVCVYELGKHLFTPQVGLWAAGLCLLFPSLAVMRTDYLLDYGLTAVVTFTFLSLTLWRDALTRRQNWLWSVSFGLGLGLALLAKPTEFLFVLVPTLWIFAENLLKRKWEKLLQLAVALACVWLVCGSWYSQNWLTIFTSAAAANAVGKSEGDPGPNTLAGWLYYWGLLPEMISWPLLLVPLGCWILAFGKSILGGGAILGFGGNPRQSLYAGHSQAEPGNESWGWLAGFCLGAYILCSLGTNKDIRFVLPYLPALAIVLAHGLTINSSRWGHWLRWGTVAVAIALLAFNLFPLPGAEKLGGRHLPYLGKPWPHSQVIAEVVKTAPYLRSNIGVISVNTPQINSFTIDFYGKLADFQVYARELPSHFSSEPVLQDVREFIWYITRTGEPAPSKGVSKDGTVQTLIEQSPEIQLYKTWQLPDGDRLKLYHRRLPPVTVEPITQSVKKVKIDSVTVPTQALPGVPVPVTYEFSGAWEQLQDGLVLLTWQGETGKWLHDGGIGLGQLYAGAIPPYPPLTRGGLHTPYPPLTRGGLHTPYPPLTRGGLHTPYPPLTRGGLHTPYPPLTRGGLPLATQGFRVVERLSMLPPAQNSPGTYTLKAVYLNRKTGETYPLAVGPVQITLNPKASPVAAPELDLITKLHQLGSALSKGKLDLVFKPIGHFNQYDPIQDYLIQAEQALTYRLKLEPGNLENAYTLALAQALQRRVQPLLETLGKITQLDAANPYAWTYLGFVHLYNFQPQAAEKALDIAEGLNSPPPEVKTLKAVASVMKLNLPEAIERFRALRK